MRSYFRSEQRNNIICFHHLAIPTESSEKCLMDMLCRDRCIIIVEVTRRTGIFRDDNLKTEIRGGTGSGIHAYVSHHASDNHTLDLPAPQEFKQVRIQERIWFVLVNDRLAFKMCDGIMNICPAIP